MADKLVFAVLAAGLLLPSGCRKPTPVGEAQLIEEPPGELVQPKPKSFPKINPDTDYHGVVTDIGSNWLELGPGWFVSESPGEARNLPEKTKKPKRFNATGALSGEDPKHWPDPTSYRLADLKVGDKVFLTGGVTRAGRVNASSTTVGVAS